MNEPPSCIQQQMQGHCLLNVDERTKVGVRKGEWLLSMATDAKEPVWVNGALKEQSLPECV